MTVTVIRANNNQQYLRRGYIFIMHINSFYDGFSISGTPCGHMYTHGVSYGDWLNDLSQYMKLKQEYYKHS